MPAPSSGRVIQARFLVMGLLILLVSAVWLETVRGVYGDYQQYREAKLQEQVNRVVDHLLLAGQSLIFERGRTAVRLAAPDPIESDSRSFIDARRADARLNMDRAIALLRQMGRGESDALQTSLLSQDALRAVVDQALSQPLLQRDPALKTRAYGQSSEVITGILTTVRRVTLVETDFKSQFRLLTRIKLQSLRLRESLGRESSDFGAKVARGTVPAPYELALLAEMHAENRVLLANLLFDVSLSSNQGMKHTVEAFVAAVNDRLRPMQEGLLVDWRSGRLAPMTANDYSAQAVSALDLVKPLMQSATDETHLFAEHSARQATSSMLWRTAEAVGVLCLGIVALLAVYGRLVRPLGLILSDARRLVGGEMDPPPAAPQRLDELGSLQSVVLAFHSLLQQHQATQATLSRLASQKQQILDTAGEGIVGLDARGNIVFANAAAQNMIGWDGVLMIGHNLHDLVHQCATDDCPIYQTLRDGQQRRNGEDVFLRRDGSELPVDFTVDALIEQGNVTGAVLIFHDISQRVQARQEIDGLVGELKRSNAELEQFAYVASHDLRQPLRMVTSYLKLIERKLGGDLSTEIQGYMGYAVDGARRMDGLICGLLEYSRIGRQPDPFQLIELTAVVRDAQADLMAEITEKGADVQVSDPLPVVRGDSLELRRLLENIIGNALKYCPADRPPRIVIGCQDGGRDWIISVQDNGIGISPADYDRAFGIFQRLVVAGDYPGTGIGLAICRKIMDHHRGSIWISAAPHQGTIFNMAFPKVA